MKKYYPELTIICAVVALLFFSQKIALVFALVSIAGLGVWRVLQKPKDDIEGNPINPSQIEMRRENLDKIMALAKASPKHLTNDEVQKALGVSDSTATRYLGYLTALGKLTRVSDRGREVYYQLWEK